MYVDVVVTIDIKDRSVAEVTTTAITNHFAVWF